MRPTIKPEYVQLGEKRLNARFLKLVDDFSKGAYPRPIDADGKDEVFVGRVREDLGNPGGILLWCVSDNVRKGAATNAIQIAEGLLL